MATFERTPDHQNELDAHEPQLDVWFAPRSRRWEFTRQELEELVRELASRPHLWEHLVQHSTAERYYVRLHLDPTLEVWLICWSQTQDTGFAAEGEPREGVPWHAVVLIIMCLALLIAFEIALAFGVAKLVTGHAY